MTVETIDRVLPGESATQALGEALARTRPAHAVVYLIGDLGAGKSTLARALLRALGVQGTIRSPTYTLIERYPLSQGGEAAHIDLYRIADHGELEFLALDDLAQVATLWLIEWPEKGTSALPAADLSIELALAGNGRLVRLNALSPEGQHWLERLAGSLPAA